MKDSGCCSHPNEAYIGQKKTPGEALVHSKSVENSKQKRESKNSKSDPQNNQILEVLMKLLRVEHIEWDRPPPSLNNDSHKRDTKAY